VERQFLYELERDFELAPATSRAVLAAAQQVLFPLSGNGQLREGQLRVTAVSVDEPSGKPLSEMKKVGIERVQIMELSSGTPQICLFGQSDPPFGCPLA
jgi:hypothetical protein